MITLKKIKKELKKHFSAVTSVSIIIISIFVIGGVIYTVNLVSDLPPLQQFGSLKISESTKIYDRTGEVLLYEIFGEEKRTIIPFEKIPEFVKQATIAAEDEGFYTQPAFDWRGILRALVINIREGEIIQGGSTITQQLIKNTLLTSEQTISRKIKEIILAIKLESEYNKDEILSTYLNQIPYGQNAYGIESASQTYFNKTAEELELAEAAILAAVANAPTYYSPYGENRQRLFDRKDYVLEQMNNLGYITEQELNSAKEYEINFSGASIGQIKAPHFALMVRSYLVNKYGEENARTSGFNVKTTLDWEIQEIAERVASEGAARNEELYGGKNASIVVQDPKTGQILALTGSRDYFDNDIDGQFNVATQGLRQPGSALKPFAYLTAFEKGFTPETILFDLKTEFTSQNSDCPPIVTPESDDNEDCFNPENFDGQFHGPVTMQRGLAHSMNIPSVKTLYLADFDDTLKNLHDAGITTLQERWRYGLSLVLGGGEVKLIDLVNAYSTLAEEGVKHQQTPILEIRNNRDEVIESYRDESERALDRRSVRQINQILSDTDLRSGLLQSSLGLTTFEGQEVALKTGTTNDYKDAWAMGYTPSVVVGVWAGNNDSTAMSQSGSSLLAAIPMWSDMFSGLFETKDYPTETFTRPEPEGVVNKPMINGEYNVAPIIDGDIYPQLHSILYWVDKDNPTGDVPEYPQRDSQFYNWENPVIEWAEENIPNFEENYNHPIGGDFQLQTNNNNNENNENSSTEGYITINNIEPENGSFQSIPINFKADIESDNNLDRVRLYLNKELIDSTNITRSNSTEYSQEIYGQLEDQNIIEIRVTNDEGIDITQSIIIYKEE